ncbi:hypothetical protein [Nocardia abscessus]|uniref:hypothetical protein n=1 Tax=Nocardia abscessus TaxID=120957 RepID=UPI002456F674|nr:hypothetical protein [Nocardia abscessus]
MHEVGACEEPYLFAGQFPAEGEGDGFGEEGDDDAFAGRGEWFEVVGECVWQGGELAGGQGRGRRGGCAVGACEGVQGRDANPVTAAGVKWRLRGVKASTIAVRAAVESI